MLNSHPAVHRYVYFGGISFGDSMGKGFRGHYYGETFWETLGNIFGVIQYAELVVQHTELQVQHSEFSPCSS